MATGLCYVRCATVPLRAPALLLDSHVKTTRLLVRQGVPLRLVLPLGGLQLPYCAALGPPSTALAPAGTHHYGTPFLTVQEYNHTRSACGYVTPACGWQPCTPHSAEQPTGPLTGRQLTPIQRVLPLGPCPFTPSAHLYGLTATHPYA